MSARHTIPIRIKRGTRAFVSWPCPNGWAVGLVHDGPGDTPPGVGVRVVDMRKHRLGHVVLTIEVMALPSNYASAPVDEHVEFALTVDLRRVDDTEKSN